VLDDEHHLVVPGGRTRRARQRLLRRQEQVEAQVACVGEAIRQIGDDAGFELADELGAVRSFSYDDVDKARTVFEWGGDAARTKPSSRRGTPAKEVARR